MGTFCPALSFAGGGVDSTVQHVGSRAAHPKCLGQEAPAFSVSNPTLSFSEDMQEDNGARRWPACSAVGDSALFWESRRNADTNPARSMHGEKALRLLTGQPSL